MPSSVLNVHPQMPWTYLGTRAHPPWWPPLGCPTQKEEQPWCTKLLPMSSALPQAGSSVCVIKSLRFSWMTVRELHIWPGQLSSWFPAPTADPWHPEGCCYFVPPSLTRFPPEELGWVEPQAAVQSLCRDKNPQLELSVPIKAPRPRHCNMRNTFLEDMDSHGVACEGIRGDQPRGSWQGTTQKSKCWAVVTCRMQQVTQTWLIQTLIKWSVYQIAWKILVLKNILFFPGENLKLRIQLGLMNNLGSWKMRRVAQKYLPHLLSQSQGYGVLNKHWAI